MEKQINTPKLRFPEFEGEWEVKTLGEIADKRIIKNKDGIIKNVLTNSAVYGIVSQRDFFDKDIANPDNLSGYYVVEKNDFVYNPRISVSAPVGPISMSHKEIGIMSPLYSVFRFNKGNLDFIECFFNTTKWHLHMEDIANYGARADRMSFSVGDFYKMPIPFPSLPEQTKIANFLSAVDDKITQLKKKKELLEQYKKGVMQQIFSQKLRFKNKNGKDFAEWKVKKLGEVCDCLDNFRKPINNAERQKMKGDIPYWGANNVMDFVNDYLFDETIVLLAEDGGNFDDYTEKPIANISYGKCWVNNHVHVLRGKEILKNEFLFYSIVHKNITGYVSGGTRAKLTKGEMLKIEINMPSLPEQTKISNFLSAIDNKINHCEKQIEKMEDWKKGLLQQMFV